MVMMTTVVLVTVTMMLVRAPVSLLAMLAVAIVGVRLCEALRDEKAVVPCDNWWTQSEWCLFMSAETGAQRLHYERYLDVCLDPLRHFTLQEG